MNIQDRLGMLKKNFIDNKPKEDEGDKRDKEDVFNLFDDTEEEEHPDVTDFNPKLINFDNRKEEEEDLINQLNKSRRSYNDYRRVPNFIVEPEPEAAVSNTKVDDSNDTDTNSIVNKILIEILKDKYPEVQEIEKVIQLVLKHTEGSNVNKRELQRLQRTNEQLEIDITKVKRNYSVNSYKTKVYSSVDAGKLSDFIYAYYKKDDKSPTQEEVDNMALFGEELIKEIIKWMKQ